MRKLTKYCLLMKRFVELDPITDKQIDSIANHLKNCRSCTIEAAAFVMVVGGKKKAMQFLGKK